MRILIIFLLFLSSCKSNIDNNVDSFNPKNLYDLSIDDYKEMLINYNKNKAFQILIIKMKKNYNIAIVGLGQVGLYLYNELRLKKRYRNQDWKKN